MINFDYGFVISIKKDIRFEKFVHIGSKQALLSTYFISKYFNFLKKNIIFSIVFETIANSLKAIKYFWVFI